MKQPFVFVMMVALPFAWRDFLSETNSAASTRRGVRDFERAQYEKALGDLTEAARLSNDPAALFNRGTAEVATGRIEEAVASLSESSRFPDTRTAAIYNRGNAHLTSKAYDRAIVDYENVLRAEPGNLRAKRNLEIALRQKEREESKSSGGGGANEKQGSGAPQQPSSAKAQQNQQQAESGKASEIDMESLLRSVEQQEREELSRMRAVRPERRKVGW